MFLSAIKLNAMHTVGIVCPRNMVSHLTSTQSKSQLPDHRFQGAAITSEGLISIQVGFANLQDTQELILLTDCVMNSYPEFRF